MKLEVGNFVLIRRPLFGYSPDRQMDLGPFIVQILACNGDAIEYKHYLGGGSSSSGTANISEIVASIHPRDVAALFIVQQVQK